MKAKLDASWGIAAVSTTDLVTRLYEDGIWQKERAEKIKQKHVDSECTFKPTVNQKSAIKAGRAAKGWTFEEWNWIDVTKFIEKKNVVIEDTNCTFKPHLETKK